MIVKYVPPEFEKRDFHCPHCGVHARQYWRYVFVGPDFDRSRADHLADLRVSTCNACNEHVVWYGGEILYPLASTAPMANEDMPDAVQRDFVEARIVLNHSPRSSAALLRLALQKLMPHLGEQGENLNDDIANLVEKGLPVRIQQALDAVRVVGNNAVHPGELDLQDDVETATRLFELLNLIVEVMVTQPRRVAEIYEKLPESSRQAIEKRDKGGAAR